MEQKKINVDNNGVILGYSKPKNGHFVKQGEKLDQFIPSATGDGYEIVETNKVDPKTGEEIRKVEKVHLWALIQECEGTCSLDFILGELSKGNDEVLNRTEGKFMDTTKLPKNIYELQEFEAKTLEFYNKDPYLKRLYKSASEYRKALSANVDIEKQIIELYRQDQLAIIAKQAKQEPAKEGK